MKQVNNSIKKHIHGLSYDEMNNNLDALWSEFSDINHKNGHFGGDYSIWKSKYFQERNSHLWHQKYYLYVE